MATSVLDAFRLGKIQKILLVEPAFSDDVVFLHTWLCWVTTWNSVASPVQPNIKWSLLWLPGAQLESCEELAIAYLPTRGHLCLWPCFALTMMMGWMDLSKNRCWLQASSGFLDSLPSLTDMMLSDFLLTSMHTKPLSLKRRR